MTLIVTNRAVRRVDPSRFPLGQGPPRDGRNIVFCFLMTAVSFILIAISASELSNRRDQGGTNDFHLPSVIAVAIAFVTKLALFLYTWALKDRYSQIFILWQDHRNDLLINGFGILTSVGGSKLVWWGRPHGCHPAVHSRVGHLAAHCLRRVSAAGRRRRFGRDAATHHVCLHHPLARHPPDRHGARLPLRPRLIAEVDVVMDPDATLMATHDVAEALQFKLESLPTLSGPTSMSTTRPRTSPSMPIKRICEGLG